MKQTLIQHKVTLFMFAALAALNLVAAQGAEAQALPTPQVEFGGTEDYEAGGNQWTRYKLALLNRAAYANELFAPAPDLAPCGANKNSARTWVDIYNRQGLKKIYGFCALKGPEDLGNLWFAVEKGTPPPQSVFITITDRRSNTRAVSNVVAIASPDTSTGATAPTDTSPPSNPEPVSAGGPPDLMITRFRLIDPNSGDVAVLVRNTGSGNARASTLRLIVWEAGQFEQKEAKTVFVKVRPLAAGQATAVRVKAGVPIINTKYSMFIDIGEEVVESNEDNNRAEGEAGNINP